MSGGAGGGGTTLVDVEVGELVPGDGCADADDTTNKRAIETTESFEPISAISTSSAQADCIGKERPVQGITP
jgi:hypothetical protein